MVSPLDVNYYSCVILSGYKVFCGFSKQKKQWTIQSKKWQEMCALVFDASIRCFGLG